MTDIASIPSGGFLAGKKTYITAITGVVGAVGAWLVGEMTLVEAFQVIWPLVSVAFLRKGVAQGQTAEGR
jgi:hypothetical protein